jgi:SAM-dependent methyltransferase
MITHGASRQLWDYVDLALLHLAKTRRAKLRSSDAVQTFYEAFFTRNDEEVLGSGADPRVGRRGEILAEIARSKVPAHGRLIDVGCGTGNNLRYVIRPDTKSYGIEYAENSARIARVMLGDDADIRIASATAIPFHDEHFDFAMCIEVLEHIEDDGAALGEIARILRPGGHLVISVPYRHWFPSYFPLMGHFRHYTRDHLEEMLLSRGFCVVQHLPNYPRWSRFANYCSVACRAYSLVLRAFGIKSSQIDVRAPFSDRRLLDVLFSWIEQIRKREGDSDYSRLTTSTFVLAMKR